MSAEKTPDLWERLERLIDSELPGGIVGQSFPKARALSRLVTERCRAAVEEERRKCINEVRAFPDCECADFCECYGRKSFTRLADQMEQK